MDADSRNKIIEVYKQVILSEISPPATCESCGKNIPTRANAMNTNNISYVFNAQVGSPGHPALPYLQCPVADHGEHWACSPECWEKVALDCISNHQKPILTSFHETLKGETSVATNSNDTL